MDYLRLTISLSLPWLGGYFWLVSLENRFGCGKTNALRQIGYGFFLGCAALVAVLHAAHALLGRVTCYKGFEYLIKAATICEGIEVHLVGKGDQEAQLKRLARELKVSNRIIFHGHLNDERLAQQFSASDCLCLPSIERTEAFGMVLLEAMYYSKATIVSDVAGSGMGWIVDNGVTGLIVAPENVDALVNCMRSLQQDPSRLSRMGTNGRRKFDRVCHIDKSSMSTHAVYLQVLQNL